MDDIANLGIRIDTTDIKRATAELKALGNAAKRANKLTSETGKEIKKNLSAGEKENKNLNKELKKTASLFQTITRITVTWYLSKRFTDAVISAAKLSEELTFLQRKLSTVTMEADALGKVTSMAQQLGVDFTELGKGVTRFAVATRNAFDVDQILQWQKGLVLSARAVGTTQKEIQSGIIQLSQSLSAGRLQGDEFRSIMENLPLLAVQLRKEFEGQTLSLKELASQGRITNDVLVSAMEKLAEETEKYGNLTDTVDANLIRLENSWKTLLNAMSSDTDGWVNSSIEKLTIVLDYWAKVFNTTTEEKIADLEAKKAKLEQARKMNRRGSPSTEYYDKQIFLLELEISKYNQTLKGTAELEKKLAEARKLNDENKRHKEQQRINETLQKYLVGLDKRRDLEVKYTNAMKPLAEIMNKNNLTQQQKNDLTLAATRLTQQFFSDLQKLNGESSKERDIAGEYILNLQEKVRLAKLSGEELAIETELAKAHSKGITDQDEAITRLVKQYYALTQAKKANKSVDTWDEDVDKEFAEIEKHWEKQEEHQQQQQDDLDALAEKYSPVIAATAEYQRNIAEIAMLHEKGRLNGEQAVEAIVKEWNKLNKQAKETTKEVESEWDKLNKEIERNLSGLFSDILRGEEDAWRNFTNRILDMFTNMIADMAAKLVMSGILDVVGGLSGGISINGSSSGGFGVGDALSMGSTALSLSSGLGVGTAGFLGQTALASSGIGAIGTSQAAMLAAQNMGLGAGATAATAEALGATASTASMGATIATVAPYALAALAAYVVVDSIFGDTNRPTNASLFAGTSAQGYREALLKEEMRINKERTDYGYGVDSPFGAMVGEIGDFGHEGQQSAEEAKAWAQAMQAKLEVYAQIDEQIINALSLTPEQIADASMAMNDAMAGIAEGVGGGDTDAAIRARYEALFNEIGGVTDEVFDSLSGSMNNVLTTTLAFINATDAEKQVYLDLIELHNGNADITGQLILNFQAVNSTLKMLGLSAYDVSISGIEAADSLVEAAGGLQQLATLTGTFFNAFYSDTEKASYAVKNYTDTITALNEQYDVNLSTSVSSYKQTVQAVLDNAEADAELKVALLQLTPVVQQVVSLQEQSAQQAKEYADALARENEERQQAIIDANNFASELYDKLLGLSETDIAQRTIDNLSEMLGIVDTSLAGITAYLDGLNLNIEADRDALQAVSELTDARITLNDAEKEAAELAKENQEAAEEFRLSMKELYYQLNDESDLDNIIRQIKEVYAEFGYFGSHTDFSREQLADFILTLDSMDSTTRDAEGSIAKLANAMIALDDYIEQLGQSIESLWNDIRLDAINKQIELEEAKIDNAKELYDIEKKRYDDTIRANEILNDFLDSLSISDLNNQSPLEQMTEAGKLFREAVSNADAEKAAEYGKEYLQFAQQFYASSGEYDSIYNSVTAMINSMLKNAGIEPTEPTSTSQLDALKDEKSALEDELKAQEQADRAQELTDLVLKYADATNTSIFEAAKKYNIDIETTLKAIGNKWNELNAATVQDIADYLEASKTSSEAIATALGIDYDDLILGIITKTNMTLIDIFNADISKTGASGLDLDKALEFAAKYNWSTEVLAKQLGTTTDYLENYLKATYGMTQDQIDAWNSTAIKDVSASLSELNASIAGASGLTVKISDLGNAIVGTGGLTDTLGGLVSSGETAIQLDTAFDAIEQGFGGMYTDNSILHFIAQTQLQALLEIRDYTRQVSANTYVTASVATGQIGEFSAEKIISILNQTGYGQKFANVPQYFTYGSTSGSMVIPESYTSQLSSMNVQTSPVQSQSDIVAELKDLKEEVKILREVSREGFTQSIKQQTRTANAQIELTEQARI